MLQPYAFSTLTDLQRRFPTTTTLAMAPSEEACTLMSQVHTWAEFKERFPNVKSIENVPMRFDDAEEWTAGEIEIDNSRPDNPTFFVRQPRDFMEISNALDIDFPYPPGMTKSFHLLARPPADAKEEAHLASFLSKPPPIHAITFPTSVAYTEEELESFLQDLSANAPSQRVRSLHFSFDTLVQPHTYAEYAESMRKIRPFGPEGVNYLSFRHPHAHQFQPASLCLGSQAFARACEDIHTLEFDVKPGVVLPGIPGTPEFVECPQIPLSLRKVKLNYSLARFPTIESTRTLATFLEMVDPKGRLKVEIGCANPNPFTNQDQEAKRINSRFEKSRASRRARYIGGSAVEDVSAKA